MARTKSLRPRLPTSGPAHRAVRLLSTLGRPGPDELDAFLEGVDGTQALASAAYLSPMDLANAALAVFVVAHEISQTCTREQRARLRGCSTRLVALALDQAVTLYTKATELLEKARACETAKRELAARLPDAELNCNHASALLGKISPEETSACLAALPSPCSPAVKLEGLADVARDLLDSATATVVTRIRLYGLDHEFIDALDALAADLHTQERLARASADAPDPDFERAHVATWLLTQHFVDTFACARQLDKSIPNVPWTPRKPAAAPVSDARPPASVSGARLVVVSPAHGAAPGPLLRIPFAPSR